MKASRILALVLALVMMCTCASADQIVTTPLTDEEGATVSILAMNSWYSTVDLTDAVLLKEIADRANVTVDWHLLDPTSYADSVSPTWTPT